MTCHDAYDAPIPEPAADRPRYVVGVNGSPASATAVRWAVARAAGTGARVQAVFVYAPRELVPAAHAAYLPPAEHSTGLERLGAAGRVRGFVRDALDGAPTPMLEEVVREGDPARRLMELAEGADLLVLGATHRRPVASKVLGSTVHTCSEHAPCPVVVVPASVVVVPASTVPATV